MFPTIPPLSLQGLEFIKRAQGLSLVPYRDENGLRVIGYGHVSQRFRDVQPLHARGRGDLTYRGSTAMPARA